MYSAVTVTILVFCLSDILIPMMIMNIRIRIV